MGVALLQERAVSLLQGTEPFTWAASYGRSRSSVDS